MKRSVKYLKILGSLATVIVLALCIVFILPRIIVFFMPFVVGFILSLIANPFVRFLEKKIKIKRKYGTVLIIVLVIAGVVFACYGIGMLLIVGIRGFTEYLPTMYENAEIELQAALVHFQKILHKIPAFAHVEVEEFGSVLLDQLQGLALQFRGPTVSAIGGFATSIPDILVNVIMGLLATYFFIADRDRFMAALAKHTPNVLRKSTGLLYEQILKAVGGYFKAQFKIMFIIYIILMIGLMVLGVNYAWLIGFGIAFLDMLPVFGSGTVLIPWAVIKIFSGNITTAVGMLVLYAICLVVHQLIQPKLVGESVGLDPFLTLFFMYIGYRFKGVVGMIIAIPSGMILTSFYEAGAFDHLIWCFTEIIKDLKELTKIDKNK